MSSSTYKLKLQLSNGNEIDAGNIIVPHGQDGKSAYQSYVDNGGTLSETEWSNLSHLKGDSEIKEPPAYWQTAIDNIKNTVESRQANGKNAFQFVWFSDMHGKQTGKTDSLGVVAQKVCEQYNIPLVAVSGDIHSQASHTDVASVHAEYAACDEVLRDIAADKLLLTKGNHDGAYGAAVGGVSYLKNIGNKEIWNKLYRRQATDLKRVFGGDGTYFYTDSNPQKIRFIMLNTHTDGDGSNDESGNAIYNAMKNSILGTEQLTWLENVALDVPEGWGIILMGHAMGITTNLKDGALLNDIISAFNNKTAYIGASVDVSGDYWGNGESGVTRGGYTNLFDQNESGYSYESNKVLTNWMPYTDIGDSTIYHITGVPSDQPYKMHFAYDASGTGASELMYCTNANKKARVTADYDSSVVLVQHDVAVNDANGLSGYEYIQFEIRNVTDPNTIIITADEEIIESSGGDSIDSGYNTSASVSKDFSTAKGEIIAYFHGHIHKDNISVKGESMSVPMIGITTAGGDVRDSNPLTRANGTATETAMDIVTIDRAARKIYMTRLGAGVDRETSY